MSARLHYFGGTTGHWAGFCSTYDPIDFQKRDWVKYSGWPIVNADLDPYYASAKIWSWGLTITRRNFGKKRSLHGSADRAEFSHLNKIWQFSPPTRFGENIKIVQSRNIHLYICQCRTNFTNEEGSAVRELIVKTLKAVNNV
jgi:choline dehydrogenase-like flavoprotein